MGKWLTTGHLCQEQDHAVIPDNVFQGLWNWFMGGIWGKFVDVGLRSLEFYKHRLIILLEALKTRLDSKAKVSRGNEGLFWELD